MSTVVGNTLPLAQVQLLANEPEEARQFTISLVLSMNDTDEEVRSWVAEALENMGPPPGQVASQLAELTRHVAIPVAGWACKLLGRLGDASNRYQDNLITTARQHPDPSVRQEAVAALGKIGPLSPTTQQSLHALETSNDPRLKRLVDTALSK